MKLKKCLKCGLLIQVVKNNSLKDDKVCCCGEEMVEVIANSIDASSEKHVPNYERKDKKLIVKVNHVMQEEHFIKWIALCTENKEEKIYLSPFTEAKVIFDDVDHGVLYSYCNIHGLWKQEIK